MGSFGKSNSYSYLNVWKVLCFVLLIIILVHLFDQYQGKNINKYFCLFVFCLQIHLARKQLRKEQNQLRQFEQEFDEVFNVDQSIVIYKNK